MAYRVLAQAFLLQFLPEQRSIIVSGSAFAICAGARGGNVSIYRAFCSRERLLLWGEGERGGKFVKRQRRKKKK